MQRAVIVVNPISGSPRRRNRIERFAALLEREGVETEILPTRCAGDGAVRAREAAAAGASIIVAAGGDGTVNDVAVGLLDAGSSDASLAVLPLGTANLVARHFGISLRSPEAAAEGLAAAEPVAVAVADCNGRLMVACAGVGLDAHVVSEVTRRRRGHIGKLAYLRPVMHALRHYPWTPLRVRVDDLPPVEGHVLVILNMRPYAAILQPAPDASAIDGLLDVVVLRGTGMARMGRWMARAALGRLLADGAATRLRGARIRVESDLPLSLEIDGDVGGETPVDMLVRPRALRVILPNARGRRRTP